jgi:hypothetical protein
MVHLPFASCTLTGPIEWQALHGDGPSPGRLVGRQTEDSESAGLNRLGVGIARVLRGRSSPPLRPRTVRS